MPRLVAKRKRRVRIPALSPTISSIDLCLPSVLHGRKAHLFFKQAIKIVRILNADAGADLCDRAICVGNLPRCDLNAQAVDVSDQADAHLA